MRYLPTLFALALLIGCSRSSHAQVVVVDVSERDTLSAAQAACEDLLPLSDMSAAGAARYKGITLCSLREYARVGLAVEHVAGLTDSLAAIRTDIGTGGGGYDQGLNTTDSPAFRGLALTRESGQSYLRFEDYDGAASQFRIHLHGGDYGGSSGLTLNPEEGLKLHGPSLLFAGQAQFMDDVELGGNAEVLGTLDAGDVTASSLSATSIDVTEQIVAEEVIASEITVGNGGILVEDGLIRGAVEYDGPQAVGTVGQMLDLLWQRDFGAWEAVVHNGGTIALSSADSHKRHQIRQAATVTLPSPSAAGSVPSGVYYVISETSGLVEITGGTESTLRQSCNLDQPGEYAIFARANTLHYPTNTWDVVECHNRIGEGGGHATLEAAEDAWGVTLVTDALLTDSLAAVRADIGSGTDNQTLSLDGTTLSIDGGNSVDLAPLQNASEVVVGAIVGFDGRDVQTAIEKLHTEKADAADLDDLAGSGAWTDLDVIEAVQFPIPGMVVRYNGGAWSASTLALSDLASVNVTGATEGDALGYTTENGWVPVPLDATRISVTPGGGLASDNVQDALAELQDDVAALNESGVAVSAGTTLDASHLGKIVEVTTEGTLTIPAGLRNNAWLSIWNRSGGEVTVSGAAEALTIPSGEVRTLSEDPNAGAYSWRVLPGGGDLLAPVSISSNTTLTAAHAGRLLVTDATSRTISVPGGLPNEKPSHVRFGAGGGVIDPTDGALVNGSSGTFTLPPGAYVTLVPLGSDTWGLYDNPAIAAD